MRFGRKALLIAAVSTCSCGVPSQREIREDIRRDVAERLGTPPAEATPDGLGDLRAVLADGLTADEAVRLALVNAPDLDAALAALGAERGDLIGASAPPNPEIDAEVRFALEGDGTAYELALLQDVTTFLAIPAGRRSATARLDAARLRAVEGAVNRADGARAAYRRVQVGMRVLDLRRTAHEIAGAAFEVAQRLYAAGNVTRLEVDLQQAEFEEARLSLAMAESALLEERAQLERLLGLWGPEATWHIADPLPALPAENDGDLAAVEGRAVERSLALAALRRQRDAATAASTQARIAGWVPRIGVGASAEREPEGEWAVGPALSVGLPLFDRNSGGIARSEALERQAELQLRARALDVRTAAGNAAVRLRAARDRAAFLGEVVVPLRQRVLEQSVLQFNAITIGIFELLRARRAVAEASVRHAEALRDYWLARADLDRLLAGGSPVAEGAPTDSLAAPVEAPEAPEEGD